MKTARYHSQMILTGNAIIAFQLTPQTYSTQMTITQVSHQHTQLHIFNENMHIEILSVMHTYNITNLTTKIYLQSKTNTQHYYSKNYKTHIGIYMTQSQLKVTKFLKTWT